MPETFGHKSNPPPPSIHLYPLATRSVSFNLAHSIFPGLEGEYKEQALPMCIDALLPLSLEPHTYVALLSLSLSIHFHLLQTLGRSLHFRLNATHPNVTPNSGTRIHTTLSLSLSNPVALNKFPKPSNHNPCSHHPTQIDPSRTPSVLLPDHFSPPTPSLPFTSHPRAHAYAMPCDAHPAWMMQVNNLRS